MTELLFENVTTSILFPNLKSNTDSSRTSQGIFKVSKLNVSNYIIIHSKGIKDIAVEGKNCIIYTHKDEGINT